MTTPAVHTGPSGATGTPLRRAQRADGRDRLRQLATHRGAAFAVAVLAFFSPWYGLTGLNLTLMTLVCIYGIAATGLNLMLGYGGMLSLGGAIFMGVGAYTTAIAHLTFGWPVLAAAGLGVVFCALAALLLGLLLVRLSGHYFGVATLGLSFAFSSLLLALPGTGGGTGFVSLPELDLGVTRLSTATDWYVASVVLVAVVLLAMSWTVAGKRGRLFRLVRNDELAASVLGVPVARTKVLLFTIGGTFTGISGVLLFTSQGLVSPDSVSVVTSVQLTMLVVIGGTGLRLAGVVGAFVIYWLQSGLGGFGDYELLVYGVVLLGVVLYLPTGVEGAAIAGWRRLVRDRAHTRVAARESALPTVARTADTAPRHAGDLLVRNAHRSFGSVVALDDVSVDVRAGAVTAVIGANGAGKSTLVNVISGIERLDRGTITLGPDDIAQVGPAGRTRRGIIRTFQVPRLVGDLSALDNIVVGPEASHRPLLRRSPRGERDGRARAAATLASLSLDHLALRPAATLSTGERKYVELARAVFSSASVLLLDEPAVGLSAPEVEALRTWLEQLRSAGAAILVIDHNLDFIRDIADHVYAMENGRVTWSGRAADLATPDRRPAAVAAGGRAPRPGTAPTVTRPRAATATAAATAAGATGNEARSGRGAELTVRGLSAGYGQITVIREVTVTARAGEVLGVIGPNGAGKSTLLSAIAGANRTARGRIALDGASIERLPSHRRLGAGLALVPEGRQVIGSLSVEANLAITEVGSGRARTDEPFEVRRARVYELFPRLAERAAVPGAVLSGGEQQMLAIGRALMTSPDVLLLDEPSQGLSPAMVDVLTDALAQLRGTMTLLVVEQNRTVLDRLADRTVRMTSGALVTGETVGADAMPAIGTAERTPHD
ncbi:ATP-binding cassette domain-containing protein [Pseudofrankia saprophytica]|uniref:ATP-binding cassette domain-containing protein n=1 Tax=Pseudofrankia saprophytica TaxID=298655 RepID=UPI0004869546|nr:ATP-binding cassette domain-containing protein [Pseudofrankia saprophytica]